MRDTLGQERVRVKFNPNDNSAVHFIKSLAADAIDYVDKHKDMDPRLAALAMTAFEEAAMWAVKLVTTEKTREHTG